MEYASSARIDPETLMEAIMMFSFTARSQYLCSKHFFPSGILRIFIEFSQPSNWPNILPWDGIV